MRGRTAKHRSRRTVHEGGGVWVEGIAGGSTSSGLGREFGIGLGNCGERRTFSTARPEQHPQHALPVIHPDMSGHQWLATVPALGTIAVVVPQQPKPVYHPTSCQCSTGAAAKRSASADRRMSEARWSGHRVGASFWEGHHVAPEGERVVAWPHTLRGDRERLPGFHQRNRLIQRRNLTGQVKVGKPIKSANP